MGAGAKVVSTGLKALDLATTVLPGKSKETGKSSTLDKGAFGDLSSAPKAKGSGAASTTRDLSMSALDLAKSKMNSTHLVSEGANTLTDFNKATHPFDQAAANTPKVELTGQQQQLLDSSNIQALQNQKMTMETTNINRQTEFVSGLAHEMTDGLKKAMAALKGE